MRRELEARNSGDVVADQVARLRQVFPEAGTEGKVNFDKLHATLSSTVESHPNRFPSAF